MKKNLLYLLILVVLLAVAGYFIMGGEEKSTLERKQDYNFTIRDTAAVDKIVISDKKPSTVTLTRGKRGWLVNDKAAAREDAIETLLTTLNRMEMRNFLPENLQQTAIRRLAAYGKKVEVYQNGKLFKTFYVGTESQDEMATYMMIEGSDAPYAVHIPGFNGFLSTRFFTDASLWRSREIFNIPADQIRKVELLYPADPEASFSINRFSKDSLYVQKVASKEVMSSVNLVNVKLYLGLFDKLSYEGAILETDPIWARRDSLLASMPVFRLNITDLDGEKHSLSGYKIIAPEETFITDPELSKWDPDRLHGFIDDKRMVLLQYFALQSALIRPDFFKQ